MKFKLVSGKKSLDWIERLKRDTKKGAMPFDTYEDLFDSIKLYKKSVGKLESIRVEKFSKHKALITFNIQVNKSIHFYDTITNWKHIANEYLNLLRFHFNQKYIVKPFRNIELFNVDFAKKNKEFVKLFYTAYSPDEFYSKALSSKGRDNYRLIASKELFEKFNITTDPNSPRYKKVLKEMEEDFDNERKAFLVKNLSIIQKDIGLDLRKFDVKNMSANELGGLFVNKMEKVKIRFAKIRKDLEAGDIYVKASPESRHNAILINKMPSKTFLSNYSKYRKLINNLNSYDFDFILYTLLWKSYHSIVDEYKKI